MSTAGTLLNGALSVAALVFPEAAPAIMIAQRLEPYAEAAIPLLQAAASQGPDAYNAAKQAAPDFFAEVGNLANLVKGQLTGSSAPADGVEVAQLAFHLAGIDPPGWAHADTQRWWDQAGAGTQS